MAQRLLEKLEENGEPLSQIEKKMQVTFRDGILNGREAVSQKHGIKSTSSWETQHLDLLLQ